MTENLSSANLRKRKAKLRSQKISAKALQPFQRRSGFTESSGPDATMHEETVTTVQTEASSIVAAAARSHVSTLKTASVSVAKGSEYVISVLR